MRFWESDSPGQDKLARSRDCETAGYVVSGSAELHLEGQVAVLEPGDSWIVPAGASHSHKILEPFTAIVATSLPAEIHERDEPTSK